MAFSMSDIQKGAEKKPRKIILYGPPKIGKSTLAGSTENALMMPTEDRVSHIDCDKTPKVETFEEIGEIFNFLLKENHKYKRFIIDSLDWLEPIIHAAVVKKLNEGTSKEIKSITDDHSKETAYFKGLKYHAVEGWKRFLQNCDLLRHEVGMDIIIVCHDQTISANPADGDPYDKVSLKIDKHAISVLEEWADIIAYYDKQLFIKSDEKTKKSKAISEITRRLWLSGKNPSMSNGNSFGLPDSSSVPQDQCSQIMEWLLTANNNIQEKKTTIKGAK